MKQYAIRDTVRTPVQCQCSCFADGGVIGGSVWDLSATGWRSTLDQPVSIGLEKSVLMTLQDGDGCHPVFIDSAIVRWSEGRHAGWEITRIDDSTQARLTAFMAQR
ncbi:MAG: PilZ domain-containing protein [Nitrospira sp.]